MLLLINLISTICFGTVLFQTAKSQVSRAPGTAFKPLFAIKALITATSAGLYVCACILIGTSNRQQKRTPMQYLPFSFGNVKTATTTKIFPALTALQVLPRVVASVQVFTAFSTVLSTLTYNETAAWRQAGGTIQFMRGTNVHIRTTLSAELHPRLRQTARYLLASFFSVHLSLLLANMKKITFFGCVI